MALTLCARQDKTGEQLEFRLQPGQFVLGRPSSTDASNKLVVNFDPTLSRQHVRLQIHGDKVTVTRDQARHPLVFRGKSQDAFTLLPGDSFQSGSTTFRLLSDMDLTLTEALSYTPERLEEAKDDNAKTFLQALLDIQPVLSEWKDTTVLFNALLPMLARIVPAASALLVVRVLPDGSHQVLTSFGTRGRVWQPSQTLLRNCLNQNIPICHVWDENVTDGQEPTAFGNASWALAAPVQAFPDCYVLYAVGMDVMRGPSQAVGSTNRAVLALVCSVIGKHFEGRRATELALQVEAERGQRLLSENLYHLTRVLTSTLDARSVLDRLLAYLHPVVPFEKGYALLREKESYQVYARRGELDQEPTRSIYLPIADHPSLSGHPLLHLLRKNNGEALRLEGQDPVLSPFPLSQLAHCLLLPLIYNDQFRGLVVLGRQRAFSDHDLKLATAFVNHVGVALENARLYGEMRNQAVTDELTGLNNRRHVLTLGREGWTRSLAFSAILFDVDHFKSFNDTYGHDVGDQVLRIISRACREQLRQGELLGRIGGEEFALLLNCSLTQALQTAERMRAAVEAARVPGPTGPLAVTISLGVAERDPTCARLEDLLKRCDDALYQAKALGRNKVYP